MSARILNATSTLPRLQLIVTAVLFSTGGAAIKATTLDSWEVATLRSAIAAVALLVALREGRSWWHPRALLVGIAYAATMILYVAGNKLTTAANTIFLQSTAPLYLLFLGPLLLREPVRRSDLGFVVALAGGMALFFVGVEPAQATAPDPVRGNVLAAICGVTWALTIFGLRWLGREKRPGAPEAAAAVVAGNLIAAAVCLPLAWPIPTSNASDWIVVSYLGLLQIGLAYVFMTRAMRRLPALEASLLLLLEPVLNALWAWLVHGERPGPWSLSGCLVILAATTAYVWARRGRT